MRSSNDRIDVEAGLQIDVLKNRLSEPEMAFALVELQKGDVLDRLRQWLRDRLKELQWNENHHVLQMKPRRLPGTGILGVTISCRQPLAPREAEKNPLLPGEDEHPVIAITASRLLSGNAPVTEVRVPLAAGKAEKIIGLTPGFRLDTGTTGKVAELSLETPLLVTGPEAVRTYAQLQHADPDQVREAIAEFHGIDVSAVALQQIVNEGVCICLKLKAPTPPADTATASV